MYICTYISLYRTSFIVLVDEILKNCEKSDKCIVVAHGRVVTSSHQNNEVKQRQAWLVLEWVTGARHAAGHV